MDESYSNQKIRLISGESVYKEQAELVGFCHNSQHPGFLIKSIVKRKQCLEKKCSHFEPFPDLPFWTAQEKKAQSKAEQKEEKKRSKLEQKARRAQTLSLLQEVMAYANWLIEAYEVPMLITGVSRTVMKDGKEMLIINYATKKAKDDSESFRDFGNMIGQHFQRLTEMRHTRMPDGSFATIDTFERYMKNRTGD